MKPTFRKIYQPQTIKGQLRILHRTPGPSDFDKAPEAKLSPEALKHVQNCIHFTHHIKGDDKLEQIAAKSPKKGLDFV